ncbi:uncharacterized protein [Magallana gigas]|uniref:uncharacterized protein n=1 Tax=Magallana gigas TaxID=29159 RepID=UPI00334135D8
MLRISPRNIRMDDTKVLKVCRVSKEIQAYKNSKTDKMMKYFNLVCAENMKTYHVRVYLTGKYEMFKEGMTYKFKNAVAKGENELWVTKDTTIAYAVPVTVHPSLQIPPLPEDVPPQGVVQDLPSALKSPSKSTVTGKIVKVSPLKQVRDGTLSVKSLLMKDNDGLAKVCLFSKNAEMNYEEGDVVQITSVYPKQFLNMPQLTTTSESRCQFIPNTLNVSDPTSEELKAFENDTDFLNSTSDISTKAITLTDVLEADVYEICAKQGCRQKKMIKGQCPVCGGQESATEKNIRALFLYESEGQKDRKITMFKGAIESAMNKNVPTTDKNETLMFLIESLPISFSGCISASNIVYNINTDA